MLTAAAAVSTNISVAGQLRRDDSQTLALI
jgi:hypothetical protein